MTVTQPATHDDVQQLERLVGAVSGFFLGFADLALMRLTEVFLSIPTLPVLLLVTYLFRPIFVNAFGPELGVFVMIVSVIGGLNWMPTARLVRAGFLSLRDREFVEAARVLGVGSSRIIFKHILPNTLSPIIVAATLSVGSSMIAEATLSFLGLGTLYLTTSAFTLAKCVRDAQENQAVYARLDQARVDKILSDHDPFKAVG